MANTITISSSDIIRHAKLTRLLPTLVEGLVTRTIIARTAAAQGIIVEPDELQAAANRFRMANQLLSASDTWTWLQKHSLSIDDFEDIAYTTVIAEKLAKHLFADEVEPFFVKNQLDYTIAAVYEVVIEDEDLAMELFYQLQEGETSFYAIAHRYSREPDLARVGGYRGALHRADLKPEVSAAVFGSSPPELLKPVLTAEGFHLIFVEDIVHPTLDEQLQSKILSDLFSEWLQQQIEIAEVSLAPDLKPPVSEMDGTEISVN